MVKMADDKASRDQSGIAFPYVDLDESTRLAGAMLGVGGVGLDRDQVAASVNQVPNSGAFGAKIAAARLFGLIDVVQAKYKLTDLGFEILDAARAPGARVEAFLNVPLYQRVYDDYRGKLLPPRPAGLEQAFVKMGVPPKQKERARQIFDRSARAAGFFPTAAEDRLVAPAVIGTTSTSGADEPTPSQPSRAMGHEDAPEAMSSARPRLHAFIEGLLAELPPAKSEWPSDERAKWLDAAAHVFDLIYKGGDADIVIEVKGTTR